MNQADASLTDRIDALLPQTQCRQCGYPGCRPYAEAIAEGSAPINRCPPGGRVGIAALAELLGTSELPLDPATGTEKPRTVARVIEHQCIGCTKCITACPVDAIVGTAKRMHSVLTDDCTGCELCVPACPVDCIALDPMPAVQFDQAHANAARQHFEARNARLRRLDAERRAELAARKADLRPPATGTDRRIGREAVLAAIARGRTRQRGHNS